MEDLVCEGFCILLGEVRYVFGKKYAHNELGLVIFLLQVVPLQSNKYVKKSLLMINFIKDRKDRSCILGESFK